MSDAPDYLSVSQISQMMRCPMQYEWRYVKKAVAPVALPLVEGSAIHKVLQYVNEYRIQKKKWLNLDSVLDYWSSLWSSRSKDVEEWGSDHPEDVRVRGSSLLREYHKEFMKETSPVASEEFFDIQINGKSIIGYIDMVEKDCVTDYKVVGRNPSQSDVSNHLQLALYTIIKKVRVGQIIALNKKNGSITSLPAKFNRNHWLGRISDMVERFYKMKESGVFPPCEPNSWMCNDKYCGYYDRCVGASHKKKGVRIKYVQIGGIDPRSKELEEE